MRWFVGVFVVVSVVFLGWLWLSPPSVMVNQTGAWYDCPSFGPAYSGGVDLSPPSSEAETGIIASWLKAVGYSDTDITPAMQATAHESLVHACDEARQNRQNAMTIGSVSAATILICAVVILRTRPRRDDGTAEQAPTEPATAQA
jgi:hypothetical protein